MAYLMPKERAQDASWFCVPASNGFHVSNPAKIRAKLVVSPDLKGLTK
jgi:hypothetical protein